jgi:CubicO group peptidase (beta-lactamase class C family)
VLRNNLHHQLRNHLESQVGAGLFPGVVWSVGSASQTWSEGFAGWAVCDPKREPVGPNTLFDLASLTKPLATAMLAAMMEERGELDLNGSLQDWVPAAAGSAYAGVTLLDLGSHAAGLPAWEPLWAGTRSVAAYVERILGLQPAPTVTRPLYSDLGYILLGAVLEAAAGKPLDHLFYDEVVCPLGLSDIGFPGVGCEDNRSPAMSRDRLAVAAATEIGNRFERNLAGKKGDGAELRTGLIRGEVHDGNSWGVGGVTGHAGLFGSLKAVVALCREILVPTGSVLGAAGRKRLLEPVAGHRSFGMVLAPGSTAAAGILPESSAGHTGFTGTSLWLDPDNSRYWVLLTNRVHPDVGAADFQPVRRDFHRLSLEQFGE